MSSTIAINMPKFGELNQSNHLLSDKAEMCAAWHRDGYLFFRDMLDRDEIAKVRAAYRAFLEDEGLIDPSSEQPLYNGADTSQSALSIFNVLNRRATHRLIHESGPINAVLKELLGEEPVWLPFTLHRTDPPSGSDVQCLTYIHEDGSFNPGLDFIICWIPMDEIDEAIGGLALAEGVHSGPTLSPMDGESVSAIPFESVPADAWRCAHYMPGDLLLMHPLTPHSGIVNMSRDRFRMSMDARLLAPGARRPIVGRIVSASAEDVIIERGAEHIRLKVVRSSYVRDTRGKKLPPGEIATSYAAGQDVLAVASGDALVLLRAQA